MLLKAVNSVLNQTFQDFEIIILDNDSSDNTEEEIMKLMAVHSCIKYVKNSKNIGIVANLNQIQAMVTSDYFCFLTDDDTYLPLFLNEAVKIFNKHFDIKAVAMRAPTVTNGKEVGCTLDHWDEGYYAAGSGIPNIIIGNHPTITNCLFSKKFAGDFFFDPSLGNSADGYILLKLFTLHGVYVSQKVSGSWNLHDNSASMDKDWVDILSRKIKTANIYWKWIQKSQYNEYSCCVKFVSSFTAINVISKEAKNFTEIDRAFKNSEIASCISKNIPIFIANFMGRTLMLIYRYSVKHN